MRSMTIPLGSRLPRALVVLLALFAAASCASVPAPGSEAGDPAAGTLPVGVARIDITPEEPILLVGYPDRRTPTDSVAQRLWAKALAFGSDEEGPAVLVSAELVGIPYTVSEEVARRLAGRGVGRERLVVSVTHTHNGPAIGGVLPYIFPEPVTPWQQAVIDRYTEQLVSKLERVAVQALADRRPARLAWGRGSVGFATNRRVVRDGRWTGFGANPGGPVDHDLPVLRVTDPDGALRAVVLGYAAHCTTLIGRDNFIHGDWAGAAQAMLEERYPGALAMVVIGAAADADPQPRGGGIPDVHRNAQALADEAARVLATTLRPLAAAPRGRFRSIDLHFERLPTRAELQRLADRDDANGRYARATLTRLDRGETLAATVPYPVQSWTFGDDLAMVFLGGEVVVDYALRLKRELDASRLWVTAYANDVSFYVASERLMAEGGYEVDGSMVYYGHPSRLARSTEDRVVRTVHDLLPRGFVRGGAEVGRAEPVHPSRGPVPEPGKVTVSPGSTP
jgi:neutral ceramidase